MRKRWREHDVIFEVQQAEQTPFSRTTMACISWGYHDNLGRSAPLQRGTCLPCSETSSRSTIATGVDAKKCLDKQRKLCMGSTAPLQRSCFHNSLASRRTNVRQWAGVLWIVTFLRLLRLFSGVARIHDTEAGLSESNASNPNPSRYPLLDLRATLAVLPRAVWNSRSLHCLNTMDDPARTFA